ncbi:MAG: c-type cytochrome domain-containing protein, partial [Planctomycetota bacterium]
MSPRRLIRMALSVLLLVTAGANAAEVDFSRDIRPILSGKCFKCHGPDAGSREADVRLDTRDGAMEFDAIVPGSPDESILMERITTDDPDLVMPPNADSLSDEQIDAMRIWIAAGAPYEQHWAYIKPNLMESPDVADHAWARTNPVDDFIQSGLIDRGLRPS